jgi:hypothetical protein
MKRRNVYIHKGGESMQGKNVGKAVFYLVVILTLVSSLALFACGGGGDGNNGGSGGGGGSGSTRNVDATETLGANNATLAGQLLQSLPPITIAGNAFDPDITGNVTLDFPTPTTFTMTGGNLPAAGVSGNVGFGNSCTFTFTQLNGFTGLTLNQAVTGSCQVEIIAFSVTVGGGTVSGQAIFIFNGVRAVAVTITVQILDNGVLVVATITTDIDTDTTGTTGSGGQ